MWHLYLLVTLVTSAISIDGAKILAVFPTPSISHQVVFRPLTQELARRGHEIVVITTDPAFPKGESPANLTEIDVHDVSYKIWRDHFLATATGKKEDLITQITTALDIIVHIFEKQIQSDEVQEIINSDKTFDLILAEAWVRSALSLSILYKVPVIQVSSFGAIFDNYDIIGVPRHPILYPNFMYQRLYNLTSWEKLVNVYNNFKMRYILHAQEDVENEMIKKNFGPEAPTIDDLKKNVHMLFLNVNPIWEGNIPVPPTVVYMGGLHQKPEKELPKDLKSYMDSSKHGVIYMSFGTNTNPSSLPPEKIQTFIKVFSQLPYDILWKWDKDELPGRAENIRISKWFPQSDLLRHPKMKLFITQGGLQSTDEAITAGVPLIGIPMLGDQWYNVEKYIYHKIGVRLDLESLTEELFRSSIENVIHDPSYRKNIIRLRTLMRDQPVPPLERAVWWTEHVLRHSGAPHLRAPAANLSWAQYLELEIVFLVLASLCLVFFCLLCIVCLLFKIVPLPRFKLKVH